MKWKRETVSTHYKYIIGIIVVVVIHLLSACKQSEGSHHNEIPATMIRTRGDSLALAARFTGDFEHFLAVTDSLAERGELSPIRADGYRGVAYFQLGQTEKCIECFRRVVAIDNPPAEDFWEYIHAGTNLVIMMNSDRDYDTAMRTAISLIEKLRDVNNPLRAREMQTLYLCLGDTQMMLERLADASKSYNEAFQWVLRTPNDSTCRPLAASIETLENIAVTHINHHMDEANMWVDRMDSLVTIYEHQPHAIEKELKSLRALVTLHRAELLQQRGQTAQAARYYADYTRSNYGQTLEGLIDGCEYLLASHRYAEAADNYSQLDRFIKEWGYKYDLETIGLNLLPKLRANYYAGRQDSALRVAMQIAEVYDTALVRQKRSESAELATIYDTQGKERQIVEQSAKNHLVTAISVAVTILALLILAFAVYVFRQWSATKKKNLALVQQITEASVYKQQLRELKQAQASPQPTTTSSSLPNEQPKKAVRDNIYVNISDLTSLTDEQLFLYLRDLIENEQLYLKADFGRQTLIDHTGLSKERLGAAFSQGSDSVSLPTYVRELRLDYAVRLMNHQPDMSIELVSQTSGFANADTFTRNFRAKYGMTPTTYKQTLSEA